jgi:glycosyltransferase involved in cell wall biosynthesis
MDLGKYVLISAARNEAANIEKTLQAVIRQSVKPQKWVIVSDGSTDGTNEIVGRFIKGHDFIKLLCIKGDEKRNFGSQVRAINIGYKVLRNEEYEFIGNLDADISMGRDYYERLIKEFYENRKLGLAGGFIYEKSNGIFLVRKFNNSDSVPHAVQLFRRECFEDIGGYIALPYGGPDWVAEVTARMKGWGVKSFAHLKVYHHRRTASVGGVLQNRLRLGLLDYSLGSHPLFELLKDARRLTEKPYIIGGIVRLCGFMWGYARKEKRMVPPEFIKYLRKEQKGRIWQLLRYRRYIRFN